MPQELNFAIFGTLELIGSGFDIKCDDFRIGQGHHGSSNNWWVGSPNCKTDPGDNKGTCTCTGGNVYITEGANDHDFYVSPLTAEE